ncbi:hypothetical protein P3G55_05395 [Leptospira sp. 96542]|nr:hypothetical protein [Leptospira sp. 96542]
MKFRIFFVSCIALFFTPLFAQVIPKNFGLYSPYKIGNQMDPSLDSEPRSEPSQKDSDIPKEKSKVKYFSINPGFTLESVTVDIKGRGNNATMTQPGPGKQSWMLDIKSADYQISKYFGIHMLLHNSSFELNNQFVASKPEIEGSSYSSSESSSSGGSGTPGESNRVKTDLGTRIRGVYSMAIPVFYFGNSDSDSFRFGLGVGPSRVQLEGNADFQNPNLGFAFALANPSNRTEFLNTLSAYQFFSGNVNPASGDVVSSYLLANLSAGNNLELLGAYLASKGLLRPDALALSAYASGRYTPLEALAISSLFRTQVNFRSTTFTSFMVFFETPKIVDLLRIRISFGGPIVKDNGYTYEFRTFHFAFFTPLEF